LSRYKALAFSILGPFKQNLAPAAAIMRRLVPDMVGEMTDVRFQHSPGRGHPRFTADHSAFDVLLRCTTPPGRSVFIPGGTGWHRLARLAALRTRCRSYASVNRDVAGPSRRDRE
jgi:hypothetical protein